ncbi:MAG TPA: hypothetical protein VMM78_19495 [Thermomicrobiales bacterium]|nr:hypothetical protein [Thermomicrobiales bacterium]
MRELKKTLGRGDLAFGVSIGTAGPAQKTTLCVLAPDGAILGFAKVGESARSKELLANEAAVLAALATCPRVAPRVPRVSNTSVLGNRTMLIQSAVSGGRTSTQFTAQHGEFLALLQGDKLVRIRDTALYQTTIANGRLPDVEGDSLVRDSILAVSGSFADTTAPVTVSHGDFAPWNLRDHGGTIRAFDWEYAHVSGIPGIDRLHFHVQTGLLLGQWSARRGLAELQSVALPGDAEQARRIRQLFVLDMYLRRIVDGHASTDPASIWWRELLHGITQSGGEADLP